jgi:uncharacterized SAM-binding protein YcdF (DUF218 family)
MSLSAPPVEPSPDPGAAPEREPMRRRWWRWPARITVAAVAVVIVYFGVTCAQVWLASRPGPPHRAQAIVVLGAAQYDGRPSPALEARLRHALDLFEQHLARRIVVTGGRQEGDRFTEATSGYNWLRRHGVPDSAILKEVQGRSTYQSLAAVERFLRPLGVSEVILVSAPSHSLRLRGVGDEVGLDVQVSPASDSEPTGLHRARTVLRETVAVGVGRVVGYRRLTNLSP